LEEVGLNAGGLKLLNQKIHDLNIDRDTCFYYLPSVLKAYWLMEEKVHYVVKEGKIIIVNEFTSRMEPDKQFFYILQAALEIRHQLSFSEKTKSIVSTSFANMADYIQ
jgi:preprotein translocase subunit SecA